MRIWKWEIEVVDTQVVKMPTGAKILDIQPQNFSICLWALCDDEAMLEPRTIAIYGTGNLIPNDPGRYISTFQILGGNLVFHAFEK